MLRQISLLLAVSALLVSPAVVQAEAAGHLTVKVFSREMSTTSTTSSASSDSAGTVHAASSSSLASTTASSSSAKSVSASDWKFTAVKSVQARVQGDAPVMDPATGLWLSKFGSDSESMHTSVLDSVNTAAVEGALMYVQAEGINVKEQSTECVRKNSMQYVVFYEMTIVQPKYSVAYYGSNSSTLEYCPYLAMDSAKCTDEGSDIPEACKQVNGYEDALDLGPCVGSNEMSSDPRAPYPSNYWFSYPNSCVMALRADKNETCREEYPGGLCALGKKPDGENCSFSFEILGYINLDDLVGITSMTDSSGNKYTNYTEFCNDGGVEFSATNTGSGFSDITSISFWDSPGDSAANSNRSTYMVELYNKLVAESSSNMKALPTIAELVSENPPCYENNPECASATFGCQRTLYAQICEKCNATSSDCVVAPSNYKFPTLSLPSTSSSSSKSKSKSKTSGGDNDSGSALSDITGASSAVSLTSSLAASLFALFATFCML